MLFDPQSIPKLSLSNLIKPPSVTLQQLPEEVKQRLAAPAPPRAAESVIVSVDTVSSSEGKITAEHLRGSADLINGLHDFFHPETMENSRLAHGEEAASKLLDEINKTIDVQEKSLDLWNKVVPQRFIVIGELPSKQDDGFWSRGNFALVDKNTSPERVAELANSEQFKVKTISSNISGRFSQTSNFVNKIA